MRELLRRAWHLLRRRRFEADLAEELAFHRAMKERELEAHGVDPTEAVFAARRAFGSAALAGDRSRDVWTPHWLQGLGQDFRLAVRTLLANRLVSVVAVLSLALGIGANTAIFSLVNSLVLRALPVRHPGELVLLRGREPAGVPEWSYALWQQVRQHSDLFAGVVAYSPTARAIASSGGESKHVDGLLASGSFFDMLGVPASVGRTFSTEDDRRGGGPDGPVTVISYRFWQRQFGGASDIVGRTLTLENVPLTIVGVTPPDFFGPDVGRSFDAIVPLGVEPLLSRSEARLDSHDATHWLRVMARLKPRQTAEQATTGLRGIQVDMLDATVPDHWPASERARYRQQTLTLVPATTGDSSVRGVYARPLLTILVVVVLVLLIACTNLANLLLAAATARRHELSVRTALGASRLRLARQQLAESVVLAAAGAAVGMVIASWAARALVRQLSTDARPVFLDLSPDWHVLAFTIGLSIATALLFGGAPALQASGVLPMEALKTRGDGASDRRRLGASGSLVVVQVALSVVLLVAAGLFVRTFTSLATRPLGFERDRVLVVTINAHSAAIAAAQRVPLYDRARQAVLALPGVADAAVSILTPPVTTQMPILPMAAVAGVRLPAGLDDHASPINAVSPGWFTTFGTPITAGRDFTDEDRAGAPRVAVVNQAFVKKFLHGVNPLGQTIVPAVSPPAVASSVQIVGVVADAVYGSLRYPTGTTIYLPLAQADAVPPGWFAQVSLSARSKSAPPLLLARSVAAAVGGVSRDFALTFQPLADQVDASLTQERVLAQLSGFFGALALLLAGLGLYGVTAYSVSRRRREIGIRVALGASPAGVVRLVISRATRLVGLGVVIGAAVSLSASSFVASLLYGLEPNDPPTLVGAVIVLAAVGAVAAWLPARRAVRIDPAVVLRCE